MNKNGKSRGREQSAQRQLMLPLRGLARAALWDTVVISGLAFVEEEMEAERAALCGPRYAHLAERQAQRSGHVPSSLVMGGRRVKIERPRARSVDGHELSLPSWRAWSARDPLDERAFEQMVLGVSTRRYARSLEALPNEFEVRGTGKSAVSERFVVGTQRRLAELMRRDLSGLALVALMIDGVHFAEHVVLAAVGIESNGTKHVLGLREGATENAAACKALLADLIERGLDPNRALSVVIDGAKALHKAVSETFGARVLIHRCHAHKKRNVADALPERMRASVHSCDEPGLCDARSQARPAPARESGTSPGIRASRRSGLPARGVGGNPYRDAFGSARKSGAGAVVDQPDREPVQPGARYRAPSKTLAGRHDDSEMDRGWRTGSRAPLPQNCRLIERCPSWLRRCGRMMPQSIAHAGLKTENEPPK